MSGPAFFDLELIYSTAPQGQAELNVVCIHSFETKSGTTWHDDTTGKTWVQDADFLDKLRRPVRVFSFVYNGDPAANLTAAAVAFHAGDLLHCLEQAIADRATKGPVGPVFFLAHGLGGIIIKKAIQLCYTTPQWPLVKQSVAGIIFFGTPHVEDDSAALFKSMKNMIRIHSGSKDFDAEARGLCISIARLNKAFNTFKPPEIQMLSFWEEVPTELQLPDGSTEETLIVQRGNDYIVPGSKGEAVQCKFQELPEFPTVYDERFVLFLKHFLEMIRIAFSDPTLPWLQVISTKKVDAILPMPQLKPKEPKKRSKRQDTNTTTSPTPPAPQPLTTQDIIDQQQAIWERKRHAEDERHRRQGFLRSLKGWSEANTGSLIPRPQHTCTWFHEDALFLDWLNNPSSMTLFLTADAGRGKSHLLRAIVEEINLRRPLDLVLSFHCTPGEESPKIWEYFTWHLIERFYTSWYDVLTNYRTRNENSPSLSMGSFVEIWQSVRRSGHTLEIFLLIDGIEQCGEAFADEFFKSIEQLKTSIAPPPPPPSPSTQDAAPVSGTPTKIRVLFTCRPTPAVEKAASHLSCLSKMIPEEAILSDIAKWLDIRLDHIRIKKAANPNHLEEAKTKIKISSGTYWLYAVHAADDVSQVLPWYDPFHIPSLPSGLEEHYYRTLLPSLQSVDDKHQVRTLLLMAACQKRELPLTAAELIDLLECLYEEGDFSNLVPELRASCSGFTVASNEGPLFLVHQSMATFLSHLFTRKQRYNTLAFICLKYLLQPQFDEPFPHDDPVALENYLQSNYPFYFYAANTWASKVAGASAKILPLLREFCAEGCPHHRAWRQALVAYHGGAPLDLHPILELLKAGAVWALRELLPPPPYPDSDESSDFSSSDESDNDDSNFGTALLSIFKRRKRIFIEVPNWPNTTSRGLTPLMLSVQANQLESIRYLLQWRPNMQARVVSGKTALAMCFRKHTRSVANIRLRIATLLLENGADPNLCDAEGLAPLQLACAAGMVDGVKLLLRHGALVNTATLRGLTPLEYAYESGHFEIVQDLLNAGADVDAMWSMRELPLIHAMMEDRMDMFQLFLAHADISLRNPENTLPLHAACHSRPHVNYLRLLLSHPGVDVNALSVDQDGQSRRKGYNALMSAVEANNFVAAELLLQNGAIPGEYSQLITCPIMSAVRTGNIAMIELLLMYGASPNVVQIEGRHESPLCIAISKNRKDIVDMLLQYGADPNLENAFGLRGSLWHALSCDDPNVEIIQSLLKAKIPLEVNSSTGPGTTPLTEAVHGRNIEVVKLLLEHGAELSWWLEPRDIESPLHTAVCEGVLDICKVLLEHEPRLLNSHHDSGIMSQTPLLDACDRNRMDIVSFLLDQGADPRITVHHFHTSALMLACETADVKVVEKLLEAAPDMVNAAEYDGYTPLMDACSRGDARIVKLLLEAGADVHAKNNQGESCVAALFNQQPNPFRALQLLMEHGVDLHEEDVMTGHNVLGSAIRLGAGLHIVKWLLQNGADPMKAQKGPDRAWRTALQIAGASERHNYVALLLEPQWGLREHLTDRDWLGWTIFPLCLPNKLLQKVATTVYLVSEEMRAATGHDAFGEMITARGISGRHLVDHVTGPLGCEVSAIPQVNALIRSTLGVVFCRPRSIQAQHRSIRLIQTLLLMSAHLPTGILSKLLALDMVLPTISWSEEGLTKGVEGSITCFGCDSVIKEGVILMCQVCMTMRGICCEFNASRDEFVCYHAFVEVELRELDWNSDEVQDCLQDLLYHVSLPGPATILGGEEWKPNELQSSLQLAILHAFNFLAIRRPLFSLYLPLPPTTEKIISRWDGMISRRRAFIERRNLEWEVHSWRRRWEEWQYIQRGLIRAYTDEDDVRNLAVLKDVGRLFPTIVDDEGKDETVDHPTGDAFGVLLHEPL